MRLPFLVSLGTALAAAAVLVVLALRTEPGGLSAAERRRALLGDIETVGFDVERAGVRVAQRDAGSTGAGTGSDPNAGGDSAVFAMPGGRTVAVAAPAGHRLTGEFVILNEIQGGFFLAPAGTASGGSDGLYVTFTDARQPMEPRTSSEAIPLYGKVAAQIREVGAFPFLDGALAVERVEPLQDAVVYCLKRQDGMLFQGATRFVGPLAVTVMSVGACPEGGAAIVADLALAEAALAANR